MKHNLPECLAEGCHVTTKHGSGYCYDHRGKCLKCGKRLIDKRIHCIQCAPSFLSVTRRCGVNVQSRVSNQLEELKDLIRNYEDAWMRGFYPELAQSRLPKLRQTLKQMERKNA